MGVGRPRKNPLPHPTDTGRPVKGNCSLTQEVKDRFFSAIDDFLTIKMAAYEARVHPDTIHHWFNRGESDIKAGVSSIFSDFLNEYHSVRNNRSRHVLRKIDQADKNWQAHAFLLEKCFAEDYGKESDEMIAMKRTIAALTEALLKANGGQTSHESKESSIPKELKKSPSA